METICYYIHALTGLHMGTGQGTGIIDLPIAREKSTGLPLVPGSGIKGVLRDLCRPQDKANGEKDSFEALFGPESTDLKDEQAFAGALAIQDAQLLCLPVRSVYGVFAWVTCPFVLNRYLRDLELIQQKEITEFYAVATEQAMTASDECKLHKGGSEPKIFLEDLTFQPVDDTKNVQDIAREIAQQVFPDPEEGNNPWQGFFMERFIVVSDDVFSYLSETGTEVRARIKLQEGTRTVQKGGLWYEENLPAETILYGIMGCGRSRKTGTDTDGKTLLLNLAVKLGGPETTMQIGGNATVGRGNVRWIMQEI